MASYRRYVATHGAARARALRQVRAHSMETFAFEAVPEQQSGRWAVLEVPLSMAPAQSFQDYVRSLAGGTMTVDVKPPVEFFDSLAELGKKLSAVRIPAPAFGQMDPDRVDQALKGMTGRGLFTHPELPVIAYRGRRSGVLRCSECTGSFLLTDELTSEDLPDGGLCTVCGRDLLIVSGVHCSICKHAPHGGEAGCHCGCRGQR